MFLRYVSASAEQLLFQTRFTCQNSLFWLAELKFFQNVDLKKDKLAL